MERSYYLNLAQSGLRMPIGVDLVLQEQPDPEAILRDGARLGPVLAEAARRFGTPLAFPHMDLELEKAALLAMIGVPPQQVPKFHFDGCPSAEVRAAVAAHLDDPLDARLQAQVDAIAYVARCTDLVPVGMAIGPFSLMTKLIADPITPVFLAGSGLSAAEDEEIRALEITLELATQVILRSLAAQCAAGARALFIAEPAANVVYLSPKQIAAGADIFERYVMQPNRRIRAFLAERDCDLLFHCCGELTDAMVASFASLDPAILSLGSSRRLWEDAALVPKQTVLYGNLPSKKFYSDSLISAAEVAMQAHELTERMRAVGHPFILGTECDVLSVPGCEAAIWKKIAVLLEEPEAGIVEHARPSLPAEMPVAD
jgi:uroporphyrinogen-III decarboxylase